MSVHSFFFVCVCEFCLFVFVCFLFVLGFFMRWGMWECFPSLYVVDVLVVLFLGKLQVIENT